MPNQGYFAEPDPAAFEEAAFRAWMQRVDREVLALCGLEVDELPDYPYRAAHDAGEAPSDVARASLDAAGFDFDAVEG